jgi:GR25 family glycosyltransferase involved in LPS biosynthesis
MKTFIIRLKDNEHSCEVAKDCYDQAKMFDLDVEYFDAINGHDAEKHYAATGIKKAKKLKKNRAGVMGCFFSHYYLWQHCIEIDEPIVILEHDGYFLDYLPDNILDTFTDVLKLDNCDPYKGTYNQDVADSRLEEFNVVKYHNSAAKNTSSKTFSGTGNYFKGTYSYILTPLGANKLVDFIQEHGHLPSDQQIGDAVLDTRVTVRTLARLHPMFSVNGNIKKLSLTRDLDSKCE